MSAPPLAFEIYLEHYKGSFGDKWMWTPIVLTPPLTAAGVAGVFSERAAKTVAAGRLGALLPRRRGRRDHPHPGRAQEARRLLRKPTYNLVMGPPLLAPGRFMLVGAFGLLAPLMASASVGRASGLPPGRPSAEASRRRGRPTRETAAPAARDDAADARPLPRLRLPRAGRALGRARPARSSSTGSSTCPELRFFNDPEAATLVAFCDVVLAQDAEPRIPVLAFIDEKLAEGRLDGYQYADMPDDRETWRLVARGLDEAAAATAHDVLRGRSRPVQRADRGRLRRGRSSRAAPGAR